MATQAPGAAGIPTPIHHALDRLTVAIIEVQRLQRQHDHGVPLTSTELDGALSEIGRQLSELSAILTALQERDRS